MFQTDKFVFFYGGVFSQWYAHEMEIDGVIYNTAEQYMMAMKADYFGDTASLKKIMSTNDPAEQKAQGRMVKNFNAEAWNAVSRGFVYKANLVKFSGDLKQYLLDTEEREIVEASPYDRVWGIGLGLGEPLEVLEDKTQWKGTNWLGECIMNVRETIRERSQAW